MISMNDESNDHADSSSAAMSGRQAELKKEDSRLTTVDPQYFRYTHNRWQVFQWNM
jgi:hypothetical protein